MRILGLDVGDRRIGIAISDPLEIIASPMEVYVRQGTEIDTEYLAKIMDAQNVSKIVIGLPLRDDGTDSGQATKTREFAAALGAKITVEIVFTGENCTTQEAEDVLLEANLSRDVRKKVIDKVAAVIILQDYLNTINHKKQR